MFYLFTIHLSLLSMAKYTQLLHRGIIKPRHHESAGLNKISKKNYARSFFQDLDVR